MDSVSFLMRLFLYYGGRLNRTNLMKLVFVAQPVVKGRWFDFVPMRRGGYSFVLARACEKLTEQGYLTREGKCYCLTPPGIRFAEGVPSDSRLLSFLYSLRHFGRMDGESYNAPFLAYVYEQFPSYAIRSEILDDLASYDANLVDRVCKMRDLIATQGVEYPPLITLGYESLSLDAYLRSLIRFSVRTLIDVRKNPISRRFGFAKSRLSGACAEVGIQYIHLPGLGIVSEKRRELRTQADYDRLFDEYETETLSSAEEDLNVIRKSLSTGQRVALTCFEFDVQHCHRGRVAHKLNQLDGVAVKHL